MSIKLWAKNVLYQLGYEISRVDKIGVNPFADMARVLPDATLIFDVRGEHRDNPRDNSVKFFPLLAIHSFEPCPLTFRKLQQATASDRRMHVWNCALGTAPGPHAVMYPV